MAHHPGMGTLGILPRDMILDIFSYLWVKERVGGHYVPAIKLLSVLPIEVEKLVAADGIRDIVVGCKSGNMDEWTRGYHLWWYLIEYHLNSILFKLWPFSEEIGRDRNGESGLLWYAIVWSNLPALKFLRSQGVNWYDSKEECLQLANDNGHPHMAQWIEGQAD